MEIQISKKYNKKDNHTVIPELDLAQESKKTLPPLCTLTIFTAAKTMNNKLRMILLLCLSILTVESFLRTTVLVPSVQKHLRRTGMGSSIRISPSRNKYVQETMVPRVSRGSSTRVQFLPQAAFAAACAWGVFSYVWNNIDEIKAKQAIAINQTMTKQAADLKDVQETQKQNIARIQVSENKSFPAISFLVLMLTSSNRRNKDRTF